MLRVLILLAAIAIGAVLIVPDLTGMIDRFMPSTDMLIFMTAALAMCVVVVVSDRRAKRLLSERNVLLDAALNNMVQGVNMYDAQAKLILWNDRYVQMYRLSTDVVRPGCTIRELVEHRVKKGTFFRIDPEQYIDEL